MTARERIRGCLLGGAVGDALGAPVEFLSRAAILALYDSARAPKRLIWIPGKHVQGNRPEVVRALITTVLATMQETAPNAAAPPAPPPAGAAAAGGR